MRTGLLTLAVALGGWLCSGIGQQPAQPDLLFRFDSDRVEVVWSREGWFLRCGEVVLKQFGKNNSEASEALRLIRELRLNQRGTIGGATPLVEYWLSDGKAPTGLIRGHRTVMIDPATVKVDSDGGQWCVRDANRTLFNFGYSKQDADDALALLQKHQFTRLILLGQGAPTMMVFLRDSTEGVVPIRHSLAPLSIKTSPIRTASLKPLDDKKNADARELAAIQTYATPSIPPLRDTTRTGTGEKTIATIPGVTDRMNRVPFDHRQARVQQEGENWVLQAGSMVIGRFGRDENLARKSLQAVQHYRFNEICLVGAPRPTFAFFTVGGQIPRGEIFGVPAMPVMCDQLKIQPVDGRQALVQGTEVVVALGERPEEARQLLDWIQRYKPDRLCRLTTPDGGGMVFFVLK